MSINLLSVIFVLFFLSTVASVALIFSICWLCLFSFFPSPASSLFRISVFRSSAFLIYGSLDCFSFFFILLCFCYSLVLCFFCFIRYCPFRASFSLLFDSGFYPYLLLPDFRIYFDFFSS